MYLTLGHLAEDSVVLLSTCCQAAGILLRQYGRGLLRVNLEKGDVGDEAQERVQGQPLLTLLTGLGLSSFLGLSFLSFFSAAFLALASAFFSALVSAFFVR